MTDPVHPPPPSDPANREWPPVPLAVLAYGDAGPPAIAPAGPSVGRILLQFWAGVIVGVLMSAIVWSQYFSADPNTGSGWFILMLGWGVPITKLAAGITFVCLRSRRFLGLGILTSIPVGMLLFVSSGFAALCGK